VFIEPGLEGWIPEQWEGELRPESILAKRQRRRRLFPLGILQASLPFLSLSTSTLFPGEKDGPDESNNDIQFIFG
jgi:hypothetical protein